MPGRASITVGDLFFGQVDIIIISYLIPNRALFDHFSSTVRNEKKNVAQF